MKKYLLLVLLLLVLLVGCKEEEKKLIIAEQYGLAYAPIQIMKHQGTLEALLPDYEIEWLKLGNTAAIREAMIADGLDAAFVGIPPFIIGYENGVEWKIISGLSRAPIGLMGNGEAKSITDITPEEIIALPQPGSIQHILLSMIAERVFDDAKYFDNQLASMKHPDGMVALVSGAVDYHFTSPPYIFDEKEKGMTEIIDGDTCMNGPFTFIVGVGTEAFKADEVAYEAFQIALNDTLKFIETEKDETTEILSKYYDYDTEKLYKYLYESDIYYEKSVHGLKTFVEFMHRNGYIEELYKEDDLIW